MFQCRTVVEQWQILTMQDWRFSFKFKEACKDDIQDHCNPKPKKKEEVIRCLVEAVATDTVEEGKHRISKECRARLSFEQLQKHSNIKLDPVLAESCHNDLQQFCSDAHDDDGGIECLKSQKPKTLSKPCRKALFSEEKEEADNNEVDFTLLRGCKREIKDHCASEESRNILRCLKDVSSANNFDPKCLRILNKRIIQSSQDYRLNPFLQKACSQDITKYCGDIITSFSGKEETGFEGEVVNCLKQTALKKLILTESCHKEVVLSMMDAAKLVGADPVLERLCPQSLSNCKFIAHSDQDMHECLREMYKKGGIAATDGGDCERHVAEMIEEASADIHADPALHTACSVDLTKFCHDVVPGDGRLFACLISVSKEKNFKLEPQCSSVLTKRIEMFGMAVKVTTSLILNIEYNFWILTKSIYF